MRIMYLGDALDHFKGSIIRRLQNSNLLQDLAVDPMATDVNSWRPEHFRLYAEILGVDHARVLRSDATLQSRGRRQLGIPGHTGDLFLDPDTGVQTNKQSPAERYVRPREVAELLIPGRLIAVYQHRWRGDRREATKAAIDAVKLKVSASAAAYISTQVSILFFSKETGRVAAVAASLREWLGPLESELICAEL